MDDWKNEPNEAVFASHGLKCKIRRASWGGHLCGYVGVSSTHAWFGKSYSDDVPATREQLERPMDIDKVGAINLFCANTPSEEATSIVLLIDVHGGLTYSEQGVGELEGLWVFGFDCAHAGDLCPVTAEKYGDRGHETYRDFEYVKRETESLARQLAAVKAVPSQKEIMNDMLLALQEVLKTPGLQSGLQAMCAAAVAKALGKSIDEVLASI